MALSTAEEHAILSNSGTAQEIEQGPASPGFQPPPADRAKDLVLEKASSLDWQIAMGNEHNYRCQAKDKKNSEINKKKKGWSLIKSCQNRRQKVEKKIEKSDSVMQFHPRRKVGKYHTILPQKCSSKYFRVQK